MHKVKERNTELRRPSCGLDDNIKMYLNNNNNNNNNNNIY